MKKEYIIIIAVLSVFLFGNFVSAICCEKLKNTGDVGWCQQATNKNQCDNEYYIWESVSTCDNVVECEGTCVDVDLGECSENTPKTKCEEISNGKWYEIPPSEIDLCQEVCCVLGGEAYFINPTECGKLFTDYGVQGAIRTDITTRTECQKLITSIKKGACVVTTTTEKTCVMTINTECNKQNEKKLIGNLKYSYEKDKIDFEFKEGLLCTNPDLNTNCKKTENTECKDNKVYWKDTCGNFANVYDKNKYNDNNDYWAKLKDVNNPMDVCIANPAGDSSCGNCEMSQNTVCENYNEAGLSNPINNENGFVCGDLNCEYDLNGNGKIDKNKGEASIKHGESWCAGTNGTFAINRNLATGEILKSNLTALKDSLKYNLPGSRYYKLTCSFGEVDVEECGDYRSSVCIEGKLENGNSLATCVFNNWKTCFQISSKEECEDPAYLCKWIPGYRWDGGIVSEDLRKEVQGSCSPLIAPGFDFWKENSQGNTICASGSVQEYAWFETNIWVDRDSMDAWNYEGISNRCINGCYSIPYYGKEFNQKAGEEKKYPEEISCVENEFCAAGQQYSTDGRKYDCMKNPEMGNIVTTGKCTPYMGLTEFYDESRTKLAKDMQDYHLSDRRGQYCNKDGRPDEWLTGPITGKSYDCTPGAGDEDKDQRKERDYPVYLTNQEWINSITERLHSLGDCGYKKNIEGDYSDPETEIITAVFQKMEQQGEVKYNVSVEQTIWRGKDFIKGELYETELPYTAEVYSCAQDYGGMCTNIANPALCEGGEQNDEATCPENMVCCVYPEPGTV